jgi:histidine triad (HIT) family protein
MATIFSRIGSGEIPSHKIAENDEFFAFLDIMPLTEGHVLVIPKKETDYFFDLDDDVLERMIVFSKKIALAQKKAIPCLRIGVAVVGLEVPHAHIHLVPMNSMADITFTVPRKKASDGELKNTAEKIKSYL